MNKLNQLYCNSPPNDFRQVIDWLLDLDYQRWDEQLESDIEAGKIDFLVQEAIDDFESYNSENLRISSKGDSISPETIFLSTVGESSIASIVN